jgi:hypothetical protein
VFVQVLWISALEPVKLLPRCLFANASGSSRFFTQVLGTSALELGRFSPKRLSQVVGNRVGFYPSALDECYGFGLVLRQLRFNKCWKPRRFLPKCLLESGRCFAQVL